MFVAPDGVRSRELVQELPMAPTTGSTKPGANPNPGFHEEGSVFLGYGDTDRDWIALARKLGVPGQRVDTLEALAGALQGGFASGGPSLIEVPL